VGSCRYSTFNSFVGERDGLKKKKQPKKVMKISHIKIYAKTSTLLDPEKFNIVPNLIHTRNLE